MHSEGSDDEEIVEADSLRKQIKKEALAVRHKLQRIKSQREVVDTDTSGPQLPRVFNMCCCCVKFRDFKNAYLCILINDIILSANLMILVFISTFDLAYCAVPCLFFLVSTLVYVSWRVQNEVFTLVDRVYYYVRWLILLGLLVPLGYLIYRVVLVLWRGTDSPVYEQVNSASKAPETNWLRVISQDNLYLLCIVASLICCYVLFNFYWSRLIKEVLQASEETDAKRKYVQQQRKSLNAQLPAHII